MSRLASFGTVPWMAWNTAWPVSYTIFVRAASAWASTTKHRMGKLVEQGGST